MSSSQERIAEASREREDAFPAVRRVLAAFGSAELEADFADVREAWQELEDARAFKQMWREATDALAAEREASACGSMRKDLERAEALIERYRRPLPGGGHTLRERLHVAKVRMDDTEANLKDETERRAAAEALLKEHWAAVHNLRAACESALEALDGYPFSDPARASRAAASVLRAALSAPDTPRQDGPTVHDVETDERMDDGAAPPPRGTIEL